MSAPPPLKMLPFYPRDGPCVFFINTSVLHGLLGKLADGSNICNIFRCLVWAHRKPSNPTTLALLHRKVVFAPDRPSLTFTIFFCSFSIPGASGQPDKPPGSVVHQAAVKKFSGEHFSLATPSDIEALYETSSGKNSLDKRASGEHAFVGRASNERSSGKHASGEHTAVSEHASSEHASGEHASGEQPSDEQASSEQASSEEASSEQSSGEQASSEQSSGEQASSEQAAGEQSSGEEVSGDSGSSSPNKILGEPHLDGCQSLTSGRK